MAEPVKIVIVNPLGAALAHYTESLTHALGEDGQEVTAMPLAEPSASGQSRLRWIRDYLAALRRLGSDEAEHGRKSLVIQAWPVLGYWDHVLARIIAKQTVMIIMHDPKPLVRAVGYGRVARWMAAQRWVNSRLIVHSRAAAQVVHSGAKGIPVAELPHPMMSPQMRSYEPGEHTVIRVLGQYKADRDVDAMKRIAVEGPSHWRFEVVGRGWPTIEGWDVVDRFVEEAEFDALVQSSSAVVIPYVRFFQSGVAVRCLEWSVPVVGSGSSSLADLLGEGCSWLARGTSWTAAVEAATQTSPSEVNRLATSIYRDVLQRWRTWLADCMSQEA